MLRAITWCAKCLFLYFLVAIVAVRFSWVFTSPIWQIAQKMHWTQLKQLSYALSYFLPIFTAAGFLMGLIPFGRLGRSFGELFSSIFPTASSRLAAEPETVPPILWAWLPVTLAFVTGFLSWQSKNSSVFDPHGSQGRLERFFGPLNSQAPSMLDSKWVTDRFLFTGPMLFLMACALAAFLRYRLIAGRDSRSIALEP